MAILTFTALISRGVCLGRAPGFQRDDVEKALHLSTIAELLSIHLRCILILHAATLLVCF